MTTATAYHYTESGLDNVWLLDGFAFVDGSQGRQVTIEDLDGLHEAIGRLLIEKKKNLTGREIRFLRHEMLMSQTTLAKLLEVSEQAIARWEKGKTQIPKPAEALIRLLYREHIKKDGRGNIRSILERIADLEDVLDGTIALQKRSKKEWRLAA